MFIDIFRPKTVEDNVTLWIRRIQHESDEVRLKALLYLQQYLAKNRKAINDMILSDTNVHPLIVEVSIFFSDPLNKYN